MMTTRGLCEGLSLLFIFSTHIAHRRPLLSLPALTSCGMYSVGYPHSRLLQEELEEQKKLKMVMENGQKTMPEYMTHERTIWIRDLFDALDADGGGALDMNEFQMLLKCAFRLFPPWHLAYLMASQGVTHVC